MSRNPVIMTVSAGGVVWPPSVILLGMSGGFLPSRKEGCHSDDLRSVATLSRYHWYLWTVYSGKQKEMTADVQTERSFLFD